MRPLTSPAAPLADHTPAFSSDGRVLAFARLTGFTAAEIYTVSLDSHLRAASDAYRVSGTNRWCINPVFVPGKKRILYLEAEARFAHTTLKITAANSRSTVRRTVMLNEERVDITAGPHELVYSTLRSDINIWRARIPAAREAPSTPERFISSTRYDANQVTHPTEVRLLLHLHARALRRFGYRMPTVRIRSG